MAKGPLVLTEAAVGALNARLAQLLVDANAKTALVVGSSGQLITAAGSTGGLDTLSLAALLSGAFSSTRALAKVFGERGFKAMLQEGDREHVFMHALGTGDLLVVLFGADTPAGLVKFQVSQAMARLDAQVDALYAPAPDAGLGGAIGARIDSLF